MNGALWDSFLRGLMEAGVLPCPPERFKAVSGLSVADWEAMNFDGITAGPAPGTPLPANLYAWADPQPDRGSPAYDRGSSLSDGFAIFLSAIAQSSADASLLAQARQRFATNQMSEPGGEPMPAYKISPGLNDYLRASLQTVSASKPAAIDFTVTLGDRVAPESGEARLAAEAPVAAAPAAPAFIAIDEKPLPLSAPAGNALAAPRVGDEGPLSFRFQAQTVQFFSIDPGRWFSEALLRLYAGRIDPGSLLAGRPVIGAGGLISSRASGILVGFKRSVTVSGSSAVLSRLRSATTGAADSIGVGSFHFAADAASSRVEFGAGGLSFRDNTNAPYVLGVVMHAYEP